MLPICCPSRLPLTVSDDLTPVIQTAVTVFHPCDSEDFRVCVRLAYARIYLRVRS